MLRHGAIGAAFEHAITAGSGVGAGTPSTHSIVYQFLLLALRQGFCVPRESAFQPTLPEIIRWAGKQGEEDEVHESSGVEGLGEGGEEGGAEEGGLQVRLCIGALVGFLLV